MVVAIGGGVIRRSSLGALVTMLLAAGPAEAATKYVRAGALYTNAECTQAEPCDEVGKAVGAAGSGDTIDIGAGTFGSLVETDKRLTFDGAGPTTILEGTVSAPALFLQGGGILRDLRVTGGESGGDAVIAAPTQVGTNSLYVEDAELDGYVALRTSVDTDVVRSRLTSTRSAVEAQMFGGVPIDLAIDDSLLVDTTPAEVGGAALEVGSGVAAAVTGSTIVANGEDATTALAADGTIRSREGADTTVALRNSVLRATGAQPDIVADDATVTALATAFTDADALDGGSVPAPLPALSGDPGLAADFSLPAGSGLIDKGAVAVASTADLNGVTRILDGDGDCQPLPDLGAFERPAQAADCNAKPPGSGGDGPPPAAVQGQSSVGDVPNNSGPVDRDDVKPVLGAVSVSRTPFAVRGLDRGAVFSWELSEAATVTFTLTRKVKKKTVKAGSFTAIGLGGFNTKEFRGSINGKRLAKGGYTAKVVARDPAGNSSATRTVKFVVS